jgi:branched-subunit amino acid ABC-type transport system permease component
MKTRYILLLLIGLFGLALLVDRNSSVFNTDRVRWLSALDWAVTAFGVAIAAISGMRLLQAGLQGAKLSQIMPAVVGFFAGVVMYQRYWAIPVAFACVLSCWLIVEHFRPVDKKSEG